MMKVDNAVRTRRPVTLETKAAIREALLAGGNQTKVALEIGVCIDTVRRVGYTIPGYSRPRDAPPPVEVGSYCEVGQTYGQVVAKRGGMVTVRAETGYTFTANETLACYSPSPAEMATAMAAVRATWTPEEHARRAGIAAEPLEVMQASVLTIRMPKEMA
jgi:hypothetical protein